MSQEHRADPGRPQDTRLAHGDCWTRAGWGFPIQVSKRKALWHVCVGSLRRTQDSPSQARPVAENPRAPLTAPSGGCRTPASHSLAPGSLQRPHQLP